MRRAKSLRIGVHIANAVVWGPVYRTRLKLRVISRAKRRRGGRRSGASQSAFKGIHRGARVGIETEGCTKRNARRGALESILRNGVVWGPV